MTANPTSSRRPKISALILYIVPAIALFDAARAFLSGWRPEGHIEHGLLLVFSLWLLSGGGFRSSSIRHRLGRHWRELLLLFVTTAIGWSALEFGSHLIEQRIRPAAPFHTRGANIHDIHHPDPKHIFGISGPAHFTTGPDGVRAPAPSRAEQTTRILSIGGSTTECVYLDDTKTWPALLEQQLPDNTIWVGNVGISGFYTRDHIRFLEKSPLMKSTALLVVQPGINDLWRFLAREENYTNFARFEAASVAPDGETIPPPKPHRPLWTHSRVIQLFHTLRADAPPPEVREGIGGLEYQIRREKRASAALVDQLPDLTDGLKGYRRRIQTMIDRCKERGVPVLFTTQPVLWRDDLPPEVAARCWFGWLEDGRYLTLGVLRSGMDQYNNALLNVCRDANVPCVDLSPMNGEAAYFYDDCHFTEEGAVNVANLVAPALAELLGPQPTN